MSDKIFFYVKPENISDDTFELDKSESHHFISVLRKSVGAEIWLTNGVCKVFKSVVKNIDNKIVSGTIQKSYPNYGENQLTINLGIGILKRDRMELVIEKATECGVRSIYPIVMDRSIKRDMNLERMKKIALAATKQCGRSHLPIIHEPTKLVSLLNQNNDTIIAFNENGKELNKLKNNINGASELLVLIGPEGDFSEKEFDLLKHKNSIILNLGERRLRSETAAICALASINQLFN